MTFENILKQWKLWNKVEDALRSAPANKELILESSDRDAAWELYIHLTTTILTQKLSDEEGTEQSALTSVYNLFGVTRDILKRNGRKAQTFAKIAIVILNHIVRPFTAKWHRKGPSSSPENCREFRDELVVLRSDMRRYAALLAYLAQVQNILDMEEET